MARGGQDRHQPGLSRRLVHRLHREPRHRVWLGNDDNSPTKKATGGGLPVEVWSRFMKAAHDGVPVAALPGSQGNWGLSNLAQAASQVSAPTPPSSGPGARPAPTRANVRPEPAAGLDGWLMDRLFGR